MSGERRPWSDNDTVGALSELARALDRIAELAPAPIRVAEQSAGHGAAALPLQNLPAHLRFARHWESHRHELLRRTVNRVCPVCGGVDRWTWFSTQDGYRYDVCRFCGMVHIPDVLPMPVWDEYFASLPDARRHLQEQLAQSVSTGAWERDRVRFERYLAMIRRRGGGQRGDRLLDLGSFTGTWLRVAEQEGIQAHGVEGLAEAVSFAREQFPHLRIEHLRTEELAPTTAGGQFDLVTMWETLEHTIDPVSSLELAGSTLRPGGLIAVTVPNCWNVQFSVLGPFCFYAYGGYHGTGHINMFSPRTLTRALEAAGFDVLDMATEFGTDWRQMLYFLLQRFDRIHCYANLVRQGDTAEQIPAGMDILLNWLSPALTRLENVYTAGPIITAVARKRP